MKMRDGRDCRTGFFSSVFQIIEHDIDKGKAKKNIMDKPTTQAVGLSTLFLYIF